MSWTALPECLSGGNLDGDLAGDTFSLVPTEKALRQHAIDFRSTRVHSFSAVRLELEGKKDKGHRTEVRFKVDFAAPGIAAQLEQYMLTIGEAKSTATISYVQQGGLPGVIASPEQAAAAAPEADGMFQ